MLWFAEDGWRLSAHVPHFQNNSQASSISLAAVADWMSDNIFDELEPAGEFYSTSKSFQEDVLFVRPVCIPEVLHGQKLESWNAHTFADAMVSSPPKGGRRGDLPPAGVVQGLCICLSASLDRNVPCIPLAEYDF